MTERMADRGVERKEERKRERKEGRKKKQKNKWKKKLKKKSIKNRRKKERKKNIKSRNRKLIPSATSRRETQKLIASFGMEAILRILDAKEYKDLAAGRAFGEALISNLSQNPDNVTNVYTGELQHKMHLAVLAQPKEGKGGRKPTVAKGLAHSASAPSKLHKATSSNRVQREGRECQDDKCGDSEQRTPRTRFGEWVDDLRVERSKSRQPGDRGKKVVSTSSSSTALKLPKLHGSQRHVTLETRAARHTFSLLVRQSQSRSLKSPARAGIGFSASTVPPSLSASLSTSASLSPLSQTLPHMAGMSLEKHGKIFKLIPTKEKRWSPRELFPHDLNLDFQSLVLKPLRTRSSLSASVVDTNQAAKARALHQPSASDLVPSAVKHQTKPKIFADGVVQDTFLHLCCEFIGVSSEESG